MCKIIPFGFGATTLALTAAAVIGAWAEPPRLEKPVLSGTVRVVDPSFQFRVGFRQPDDLDRYITLGAQNWHTAMNFFDALAHADKRYFKTGEPVFITDRAPNMLCLRAPEEKDCYWTAMKVSPGALATMPPVAGPSMPD
jgi:hypothetical protein